MRGAEGSEKFWESCCLPHRPLSSSVCFAQFCTLQQLSDLSDLSHRLVGNDEATDAGLQIRRSRAAAQQVPGGSTLRHVANPSMADVAEINKVSRAPGGEHIPCSCNLCLTTPVGHTVFHKKRNSDAMQILG